MNRLILITQIEQYQAYDQGEEEMRLRFLELLNDPQCFLRSRLAGHLTASAWVLNHDQSHVLLMHHKKLDKWLQPGGHCDGDENVFRVAQKEVQEETGLNIKSSEGPIFDLDIHHIPERKGVPAHEHYDIRFQFVASKGSTIQKNDESNDLQWVELNDLRIYTTEVSILRMLAKSTKGESD